MNGINFSVDGPMMSGSWYNPHTQDSFTVRDTFFENNQLLVSTTDGRMLDYNMIQNYVQCDPKDIPAKNPKQTNDIPSEVASILESPIPQDPNMLEEDMNLINGYNNIKSTPSPLGNLNKINNEGIGKSEDQRLVERVLSRQQQPSINCNINWTKFPQKQMDVLMDMMGVDIKDVCDFYISKINLSDIRESIKKDIENFILVAMGYIVEEAPVQIQESVTIVEHDSTEPYKPTAQPQKKTRVPKNTAPKKETKKK